MRRIQYRAAFPQSRGYVPAVVTQGGRTVWLSGVIGSRDVEGRAIAGFAAQAARAFEVLATELARAGGSLADVVTMTVYITDVRHFMTLGDVRKRYFEPSHYAASALVTIPALPDREALVEIAAVAVLPDQ